MVAQGLRGLLVPVDGQVIKDDHSAGRDLGDQNFADLGGKGGVIDRATQKALYRNSVRPVPQGRPDAERAFPCRTALPE